MNKSPVALRAVLAAVALLLACAPSQARFLQADPVGYADDMNMYTYVQNDPMDKADPKGLAASSDRDNSVGPAQLSNNTSQASTQNTTQAQPQSETQVQIETRSQSETKPQPQTGPPSAAPQISEARGHRAPDFKCKTCGGWHAGVRGDICSDCGRKQDEEDRSRGVEPSPQPTEDKGTAKYITPRNVVIVAAASITLAVLWPLAVAPAALAVGTAAP